MSQFEEDGLNKCDHCSKLWICCECKEEDFKNTTLDPKSDKKPIRKITTTVTIDTIENRFRREHSENRIHYILYSIRETSKYSF